MRSAATATAAITYLPVVTVQAHWAAIPNNSNQALLLWDPPLLSPLKA